MRKPKGTPTHVNIFALAEHFEKGEPAPARCDAVSAPHLRRCIEAGLATVDLAAKVLRLTDAGRAAIQPHLATMAASRAHWAARAAEAFAKAKPANEVA